MRNLISLFSVLSGAALLAASAHADDNPQTNVFNADMSNPDLAAVITSFQDVCLPFIVHTTELPQSLNIKHYSEQLAGQGLILQKRESKSERVLVEPGRAEWKPLSQQIHPKGQFTVFNGISNQVVESTQTVVNQTAGEINLRDFPPRYKTVTHYTDSYLPEQDDRMKITLGWNYASQNHPAKSCGIKLDQASISPESFEADFIEKDADWYGVYNQEGRWTQCSRDGADEFEFSAERKDGVLSLSVRRNDFYEPDICINWLSARQAFP